MKDTKDQTKEDAPDKEETQNKATEEQTNVDEVKSPEVEQVEEEPQEEEKVPEVEPLWEGIIGMIDLNPFTANMHPVCKKYVSMKQLTFNKLQVTYGT